MNRIDGPCVVVTLDVGEAGFVDFLIDSGATTALISPKMREMLGDSATDGAAIRGLGAMAGWCVLYCVVTRELERRAS